MKSLFVFWHGLGDNILATPAIRKYKQITGNFVGWAMLRRFSKAKLFDCNPHIDQLHWISDAWNDFRSYSEGCKKVIEEGLRIKKDFNYDELYIIDHKSSLDHKIYRTAKEMNIDLEDNVHTEIYYNEKDIECLYDTVVLPDEYIFFHGETGVKVKDLSLLKTKEWLKQRGINLPIISPNFTWDCNNYPISFAMGVMKKAKYIIVADSVMYHAAHAMDLNIDLAYFGRGESTWRMVHSLHSNKEYIVYNI